MRQVPLLVSYSILPSDSSLWLEQLLWRHYRHQGFGVLRLTPNPKLKAGQLGHMLCAVKLRFVYNVVSAVTVS